MLVFKLNNFIEFLKMLENGIRIRWDRSFRKRRDTGREIVSNKVGKGKESMKQTTGRESIMPRIRKEGSPRASLIVIAHNGIHSLRELDFHSRSTRGDICERVCILDGAGS